MDKVFRNDCKVLPSSAMLQELSVEIESASLDYSRDQNKKGNKIPVVSVSDRGKRIGNLLDMKKN